MNESWFQLLDPSSRKPLRFLPEGNLDGFGYLADDDHSQRWPVVMGIPFLRADRIQLANQVVRLIIARDYVNALALLLQDTDDFARRTPELSDCLSLAKRLLSKDDILGAREMMELLQYGAVADYFALRGLAPTFFSGIGLLKIGASPKRPVFDVGCGVGHFLYWLQTHGFEAVGTDSVFSKLCLAHRFFRIKTGRLVCAVVGKVEFLPLASAQSATVLCHDAFYFIKDKGHSLTDFRRLAGTGGSVLIGHAHLSTADHGEVSGYPLLLDEYRRLAAADAYFFDDSKLVAVGMGRGVAEDEIASSAEAVSFVEGMLFENKSSAWQDTDERLHVPLGVTWSPEECRTRMEWPSKAFAEEYRAADYLVSGENPFEQLPARADHDLGGRYPVFAVPTPFFTLGVRPLRWGIIGGGWITTDYFAPAFRWTPHAQLVGLAEVSDERRAAHGGIPCSSKFADWREMLAQCELDAVYIATPNHLHAEMIEGVAAAGVRVLCEKPITTSLDDITLLRNCSRQQPDFFQTAYDQRYHPAHLQLARQIAQGVLGTVTQVRIHYACWVDGGWNKVSATDNWRIDPSQAGGGAGFDLLPHGLDLIAMLVADSITEAHLLYQGRVHDYAKSHRIDDGAVMSVRTTNGILASLHVGYNCPENQPRRRIEIIGTEGRVDAFNTMGQDPSGELIWQTATGEKIERFPEGVEAGPFVRQLDAVSRLWIRGDTPQFPFEKDLELAECLVHCDAQARLKFS